MEYFFEKKSIFVTGSCGTVGKELIKQLLNLDRGPKNIIGIDNNESNLFFQDHEWMDDERVNFYVSDLRDAEDLKDKMKGCNIVFHCAALKHVILCEKSPGQAVLTNVIGVQNVISAAQHNCVEKVIFTSSDKAVNPTNVMGTSKLMGERLMTAANSNKDLDGPVFASTRFGNVLGSNGSVVPIFKKQIANDGPVTLTDKRMTRFVMSVEESVKLVLDSSVIAKGGEVFVTKMPVVNIESLAKVLIDVYARNKDIEIAEIGSKPGEKLYEELMSDEETKRALELEQYFVILPAFKGLYDSPNYRYEGIISRNVVNPYNSSIEKNLNLSEVEGLLRNYRII